MEFHEGERGVSPVIGFVFVFAFAIVLLSGYQAAAVPAQNEATEFNHYTEAQNDFAALQAAFDNAGSTGDTYQATIRMGTQYPSRALFLNPAPATGQLSSSASGEIEFTGAGGTSVEDICGVGQGNTRTFEYRPNYNELSGTGRLVFENGVAYRQIDESVVFTDSDSFIDGNNIDLRPLVDAPSTTGSADTREVTFEPGEDGGAAFPSDETSSPFEIEFPSRLEASTWANEILDVGNNGYVEGVRESSDGDVIVTLDSDKDYTITCRAVGIDDEPSNAPGTQEAGTGEPTGQTNPSPAQAALVWEGASKSNNDNAEVTFKNTGDSELQIESVRYQFYSTNSGQLPDELEIVGNSRTDTLTLGGSYVDVSDELSPISTDPNNSATYTFDFSKGVQSSTFFIVSIRYTVDDESTEGTYFIGIS